MNVRGRSDQEIEAGAWHWLPTAHLVELCDPFGAWVDLETPIKPEEVQRCLAEGREALVSTPIWYSQEWHRSGLSVAQVRDNHVRKIAYFVKQRAHTPIELDVGIPDMGCFTEHLVSDGNHRLAGAVIRGDEKIAARVGGSVRHAKELGLWNPNACEREQQRRWNAERRAGRARSKPR